MFNWHVCDFDGGDCCTNSSAIVNTMFCEDCFCLQNYPVTDKCYFTAKIGNEICDDLANTEECSYDGGKYINISSVVEFQIWWVLKSKIFAMW